jgi:hypothetical protein
MTRSGLRSLYVSIVIASLGLGKRKPILIYSSYVHRFFSLITTLSGFYQSCCPKGDLSWQRQVWVPIRSKELSSSSLPGILIAA